MTTTDTAFDLTQFAHEFVRDFAAENGHREPDTEMLEIVFAQLEPVLFYCEGEPIADIEEKLRSALVILMPESLTMYGEPEDQDGMIEDALFADEAGPLFASALAEETEACLRGVLGREKGEELLQVFRVSVERADQVLRMLDPVPYNFSDRPRWIDALDRDELNRLVSLYEMTEGWPRSASDIAESLWQSFRRLAGSTIFASLLRRV